MSFDTIIRNGVERDGLHPVDAFLDLVVEHGRAVRNMAFYNSGLRLLRQVHDAERAGRPFMSIESAVHRTTGELGDRYDIDTGHLCTGDRADLVVVDPERLDERLDAYAEDAVAEYGGMSRMVNRNDETVSAVLVSGRAVFVDGSPTGVLGPQRTGSFLRAGRATPAPEAKGAPAHVG